MAAPCKMQDKVYTDVPFMQNFWYNAATTPAKEILVRSRLWFWKYPISIFLLLFVIAAFTLVYSLSDTAAAPYDRADPPEGTIMVTPEPEDDPEDLYPEDIPEEPDPEDEPEEEPEPVFVETGYITIEMEESEIHQGYLLLVNHDHTFEIPNNLDLVRITEARTTQFRVQPDTALLLRSVIDPLDEMMASFITSTNNRSVAIRSAHRNYETQQRILNGYISQMGRREALRWAALPRHSEHHTGLAFDFGIMSGNTMNAFHGNGSTAWFRRNSYRYGFIVRYQQNKTRITQTNHEPWHFRYVGLPHSALIHQRDWCLEEFIENIREYTFEEPMEFEYEGILYEMYFVEGTTVRIPVDTDFDISGNNIDGFIVTIIRLAFDPDNMIEV